MKKYILVRPFKNKVLILLVFNKDKNLVSEKPRQKYKFVVDYLIYTLILFTQLLLQSTIFNQEYMKISYWKLKIKHNCINPHANRNHVNECLIYLQTATAITPGGCKPTTTLADSWQSGLIVLSWHIDNLKWKIFTRLIPADQTLRKSTNVSSVDIRISCALENIIQQWQI